VDRICRGIAPDPGVRRRSLPRIPGGSRKGSEEALHRIGRRIGEWLLAGHQLGPQAAARDGAADADETFAMLMGDDVEQRRSFIQRNASDVRFLDI